MVEGLDGGVQFTGVRAKLGVGAQRVDGQAPHVLLALHQPVVVGAGESLAPNSVRGATQDGPQALRIRALLGGVAANGETPVVRAADILVETEHTAHAGDEVDATVADRLAQRGPDAPNATAPARPAWLPGGRSWQSFPRSTVVGRTQMSRSRGGADGHPAGMPGALVLAGRGVTAGRRAVSGGGGAERMDQAHPAIALTRRVSPWRARWPST